MFCSNCGNELKSDAKFCSNCGTPTSPILPSPNVENQHPQPITQDIQIEYPFYPKKINGVTINVAELAIKTQLFDFTNLEPELKAKAKHNAIEQLKLLTGAGMMKATFNVEQLVSDKTLKTLVLSFKNGNHQSVQPVTTILPGDDQLRCPECHSTQIEFDKQGFSGGKAIVGGLLTGGIGLAAGFMGKNKRVGKCLKCGHEWKI